MALTTTAERNSKTNYPRKAYPSGGFCPINWNLANTSGYFLVSDKKVTKEVGTGEALRKGASIIMV